MIVVELTNWCSSRTARLEVDNDCVYLYSCPNDNQLEFKSLWVTNTKKRFINRSDIVKESMVSESFDFDLHFAQKSKRLPTPVGFRLLE